jgi:hypothetical protein
VQKWLGAIKSYETEYAPWERRVDKILKRYRDENRQAGQSQNPRTKFNILWSNVQTLVPATFARLPQPDVSRRFSDRDPVGRVAALILERALDYEIQHYRDYRSTMKQCVMDRFLGGRGTAWARYEPHIKAASLQQPVDGTQVTEDAEGETPQQEALDYECAPVDYVHWKDFGHTVARTWEEVPAVWRKVYMGRQACVDRFGKKKGDKIPLDATPEDLKRADRENPELKEQQKACVYEIWDKDSQSAIWLSKSMKEVLDTVSAGDVDEQGRPRLPRLEDFFPCPRPLYATMTNESLIPIPDFTLYQDQAAELDLAADRIDGLLKAMQVKGVYDGSLGPEIARLFTDADNTDLRAVKNWQAFAEKNGLKGAIDLVDLTPIAGALKETYLAMEQIKNQVYEITGISDIIRGQTEASETATAQQIKGQYATLRLRALQQDVAQFATELLRLKAQIVATFDPQTLVQISAAEQLAEADKQYVMPALQLIADRPLRNFRIEIAADTLVQIDEDKEKEQAVEFITGFGNYIKGAAEVGAMAPPLVPLLIEVLKWSVTKFKMGKTVEGTIDQALEQLKEQAAQPPPPDPKMEAERAKAVAKERELSMKEQSAVRQDQREERSMMREEQHDVRQAQIDGAVLEREAQFSAQQHQMKMAQAMLPPKRKQ